MESKDKGKDPVSGSTLKKRPRVEIEYETELEPQPKLRATL